MWSVEFFKIGKHDFTFIREMRVTLFGNILTNQKKIVKSDTSKENRIFLTILIRDHSIYYASTALGSEMGHFCLLTVHRGWVGGLENTPKHAYVIFELSLCLFYSS